MGLAMRARRSRRLLIAVAAGLLLDVAAIFPSSPAQAQSSDDAKSKASELRARAESEYDRGVEAFRNRRYREAANHFERADELFPSAAYSYNVALALDKMGDTGGALQAYRQYLRRRVGAPNARTVLERISALEAKLAEQGLRQLTITSAPAGAAVSIDGATVGTTPWTGEISAGRHRLRISHEGYAPLVRMLDLDSTRARDFDFRLARTTKNAGASSAETKKQRRAQSPSGTPAKAPSDTGA